MITREAGRNYPVEALSTKEKELRGRQQAVCNEALIEACGRITERALQR